MTEARKIEQAAAIGHELWLSGVRDWNYIMEKAVLATQDEELRRALWNTISMYENYLNDLRAKDFLHDYDGMRPPLADTIRLKYDLALSGAALSPSEAPTALISATREGHPWEGPILQGGTVPTSAPAEDAPEPRPLNAAGQSARDAGCNCDRKMPYLDWSHDKDCSLYRPLELYPQPPASATDAQEPQDSEWIVVPDEEVGFVARSRKHSWCTGHGATKEEAIKMASETLEELRCPNCGAPDGDPEPPSQQEPAPKFGHHPDPLIDAQVEVDRLRGHLKTAETVLSDVLSLDVASANGQRVKNNVRWAIGEIYGDENMKAVASASVQPSTDDVVERMIRAWEDAGKNLPSPAVYVVDYPDRRMTAALAVAREGWVPLESVAPHRRIPWTRDKSMSESIRVAVAAAREGWGAPEEYHRRGVEIIHWTEIAGAHLCRAEKAEAEITANLKLIPESYRVSVREGAGPENDAASLAVSIAKLAKHCAGCHPWAEIEKAIRNAPLLGEPANPDVLVAEVRFNLERKPAEPTESVTVKLTREQKRAAWNEFRPMINAIGDISVQEAMDAIERSF